MTLTSIDDGAREYLLALADDEHMMGSHLAWWIGIAPFLEEDLSLCSIAQDELGHAIAVYELLVDDVDHFALRRQPSEYRSCSFVEMALPQWEDTLIRHWLYDVGEQIRWNALVDSSVRELSSIAQRALAEESFHRSHSTLLLRRSLSGSEEARQRLVSSMESLLPQSMTMWSPVTGEVDALAGGVTSLSSSDAETAYSEAVQADLNEWGISLNWAPTSAPHNDRVARVEGFDEFHASLNLVLDLDPDTEW